MTLLMLCALCACDMLTDSATRLAFDIERGISGLGKREGDEFVIVHRPRLKTPGGDGRVRVQLDKVGALIVWYSAMTWAQRLKLVFGIDIQTCEACGGPMRIIACRNVEFQNLIAPDGRAPAGQHAGILPPA